ncbi:hypothetical protein [uncultured Enterovirga sp.]|uniref:hypothetical protein n=1 Tax=uncultured Enterovirga sp. TaxID=2026352 RepID=UPI0035CB12B5
MKQDDHATLQPAREGSRPAAWTGTARGERETLSNVMGPDGHVRVRIARDVLIEAARQTGKRPAR